MTVSNSNVDWDVSIPFNEGIEIERGYGSFDSNGNRALNFSRASDTGNINKSGNSETNSTDVASIGRSGLGVFGSYTALTLDSNNVNFAAWNELGSVVTSPTSFREDTSTGVHLIEQIFTSVIGDTYCLQCKVRATGKRYIRIQGGFGSEVTSFANFDIVDGFVTSTVGDVFADIERVDGDFYLVSMIYTATVVTGGIVIYLLDSTGQSNSYTGDGLSGIDVNNISSTDTGFLAPFIATTTTAVVRAADVVSVSSDKNLPAMGSPFYLFVDVEVDLNNKTERYILDHNQSETNGWSLKLDEFNTMFFTASDGTSTVFSSYSEFDESRVYKICIGFDGEMIKLYVDGLIKGDNEISSIVYDFSDIISIGSDFANANHLNSSIKNLRIKNGELTDAEIKLIAGE